MTSRGLVVSPVSWPAFALARPTVTFPVVPDEDVDSVEADEATAPASHADRGHELRKARLVVDVRMSVLVDRKEGEALGRDVSDGRSASEAGRRCATLGETAAEVSPVEHKETLVAVTVEVKGSA